MLSSENSPATIEEPTSAAAVGAEQQENVDKTCVVCFKIVDIFSIGECDHPVCYECSTRMRVLCQQNECPICRRINQKVIFTSEVRPYRELDLRNRSGLYNKTFRIIFTGQRAMNAFQRLLEHPCSKCSKDPLPTAAALKEHLRKEHELFYCDICTEHLKIFSFERKAYTREQLALHRRKGDPDNTSHRGHPLCEYCDVRYLDRDELYRHLRRDHFYCHFCDLDGTGSNNFYADHQSLREHFIDQHYLCEEGECRSDIFTAVFRSDIDLKAHKASVHGQTSRQARTINFEFNLPPRSVTNARGSRYDDGQPEQNDRGSQPTARTPIIDARNEQEFPSLGNGSSAFPLRPGIPLNTRQFGTKGLAKTKENFPALGGANAPVVTPAPSAPSTRKDAATALFKNPPKPAVKAKISQAAPSASKVSLSKSAQDFPSLPGASGNPLAMSKTTKSAAPVANPVKTKSHDKVMSARAAVPLTRAMFDFPSFSGGADARKDIQTDFIESTPSFSMANVSAKHRALVPSYESVSAGQSGSKINTVQRVEAPRPLTAANERAPAINSKASFPTLGNAAAPSAAVPQWLAGGPPKAKKPTQMSKKLKVAPAPLLLEQPSTANAAIKPQPEEKSKAKVENKKVEVTTESKKPSKKEKKNSAKVENGDSALPKAKGKEKANNSKENHKKSDDNKKNNNNPLVLQNGHADNGSERSNSSNDNCLTAALAVTRSHPPPGFSGGSSNSVKPPPGFVATAESNGTAAAAAYEYAPPSNATRRNQILVLYFQTALKTPEAVEQFRNISKLFREDMCNAVAFYEHCEATLDAQFHNIFPELLILLPDIKKQQELFDVYIQRHPSPETVLLSLLRICEMCKQVVKQNDFVEHLQLHSRAEKENSLNENFPKLCINAAAKK